MPESAEEVYARVVALVGEDGRLPVAPSTEWDIFPYEGPLVTKVLQPPLEQEEPRWGEGERPCSCTKGESPHAIWRNERWTLTSTGAPSGLPLVLMLRTHEHLDHHDLDDAMAAELGVLSVRLDRVMLALPHIGRVHVSKIGDGGSHLHVWFIARTARLPQVLGSLAQEWDEILPPAPEDVWRADLAAVAAGLASYDGQALV